MTGRAIIAVSALVSTVVSMPLGASAQLDLRAPPRERVGPRGLERYIVPLQPPDPSTPRFVTPLSQETETGRAGAAFFSPRNPPVGPRGAVDPDRIGWLGFGFAGEWGASAKRTRTN
jgi:hypothetical protein